LERYEGSTAPDPFFDRSQLLEGQVTVSLDAQEGELARLNAGGPRRELHVALRERNPVCRMHPKAQRTGLHRREHQIDRDPRPLGGCALEDGELTRGSTEQADNRGR